MPVNMTVILVLIKTGRARIIGIGREVQAKRKTGEVFPIDLAVTEITHSGETQYVGIIRDITEQKKMPVSWNI